jgi:hypothetical protein
LRLGELLLAPQRDQQVTKVLGAILRSRRDLDPCTLEGSLDHFLRTCSLLVKVTALFSKNLPQLFLRCIQDGLPERNGHRSVLGDVEGTIAQLANGLAEALEGVEFGDLGVDVSGHVVLPGGFEKVVASEQGRLPRRFQGGKGSPNPLATWMSLPAVVGQKCCLPSAAG